jgi:ribose transport system permease protein
MSGGNQQKIVVGRCLEVGSRLLVLEEPTTGVDVGAKAEIYATLSDALHRGLAVILISSDFDEVAQVCSRALVFRTGRVAAELSASALTVPEIIRLASIASEMPADALPPYTSGRGRALPGSAAAHASDDPVTSTPKPTSDDPVTSTPKDQGPRSTQGPAGSRAGRGLRGAAGLLQTQGLLALTAALVVLFSVLLPDTFPTALNARSILGDKSIVAIAALAAMVPMTAGKFDLSIGYAIGLSHIATLSLQLYHGVPWQAAALAACAAGAAIGLLNGLLVELARIDSFIATLGTGTVLYAISNGTTAGRQVVGALPDAFLALSASSVAGVPMPALYLVLLGVFLWIVLEYLPVGRFLHAIGSNPEAARLAGIPVRRCVIWAFVTSGFLSAFAGVALASKLQIGQSSVGMEFLLPAFVGSLLGSTTVHPGRFNVWGTLIAVLLLAVGIAGIQQMGSSFFVEPLFNGLTLIAAVGLAAYGQRRRALVHTPDATRSG